MNTKSILYLASIVILCVGLTAAGCIYFLTDDAAEDSSSYTVPLHSNKLYVRDLQRFGGKAAVLFDDFNRWFAGLWQGRALASTVLCLSLVASLAVFMTARVLFPDTTIRSGNGREEPPE